MSTIGQIFHPVWVGEFGEYPIPDRFKSVRISRNGMPDRRYTLAAEFMLWVESVDKP